MGRQQYESESDIESDFGDDFVNRALGGGGGGGKRGRR